MTIIIIIGYSPLTVNAMETPAQEEVISIPLSLLFKNGSIKDNNLQFNLNEQDILAYNSYVELVDESENNTMQVAIVGTINVSKDSSKKNKVQITLNSYEKDMFDTYYETCINKNLPFLDPTNREPIEMPILYFTLQKKIIINTDAFLMKKNC